MRSNALAVIAAVATLWLAAAIPSAAENSRWRANYKVLVESANQIPPQSGRAIVEPDLRIQQASADLSK